VKIHWKELVIALLLAVALWYGVSGSERVESSVEVRLDYRGLPKNFMVLGGQVNKIEVRVSAPIGMVPSITARPRIYIMDLSKVRKGENILTIDSAQLQFRQNVEIIDVLPSRVRLEVDEISNRQVPVEARIDGMTGKDLLAQATFQPPEVTLTGPSTLLELIDDIEIPVVLKPPLTPGVTEETRAVPVPEEVDSSPPEIVLSLQISVKRKQAAVTREVQVDVPEEFGKYIRPNRVKIVVSAPESQAASMSADKAIKAHVTLERRELGSYTLPVKVSLPEGVELVRVEPAEVTVTLEQKRSPASEKSPPAPKKK
jgi:YbbR domain-containing protein